MSGVSKTALAESNEIDFSEYKNPELADSIKDALGLRSRVSGAVSKAVKIMIPLLIPPALIFYDEPLWAILIGMFICMIPTYFSALTITMLMTIKQVTKDLIRVLDLSFELTEKIQADFSDEGKTFSPYKAFQGVVHNLIHPTVETLIDNQLGFFGKPIAFTYRRAFNILDKRIAQLMNVQEKQDLQSQAEEDDFKNEKSEQPAVSETEAAEAENKPSLKHKLADRLGAEKVSGALEKVKSVSIKSIGKKASITGDFITVIRKPVVKTAERTSAIVRGPLYVFAGIAGTSYLILLVICLILFP